MTSQQQAIQTEVSDMIDVSFEILADFPEMHNTQLLELNAVNIACDNIVKATALADGWDWNNNWVDYLTETYSRYRIGGKGKLSLSGQYAMLDMYQFPA